MKPVRFYQFSALIIFSIPLIWLISQFNVSLYADHAWLMIAAQRFLDGQLMSEAYFDPNPPLSILIYIPILFISYLPLVEPYYAPYLFGLICLLLSLLSINVLLKAWPAIDQQSRHSFLFGFFLANSILTMSGNFYFGERDQIVILGLMPFLIAQLSITQKIDVSRLFLCCVFFIGAVCILIKPHYGIFPVILLAHRMYSQRIFFSITRHIDFLALSSAVILYGSIILLAFRDYISVIFPFFVEYYIPAQNPRAGAIWYLYLGLILATTLAALISGIKIKKLKSSLICFLASFLCLLLFLLQMKGIYYHLIPALSFYMAGLALLLAALKNHYFKKENSCWFTQIYRLALLFFSFCLIPQAANVPHHADYMRAPAGKYITGCEPDCSFFMFTENIDTIHQLALYSENDHASRFPVLWWLPDVIFSNDESLKDMFASFVVTDLKNHKPKLMIIATNLEVSGVKNFDLIDFLSRNETFLSLMNNYEHIGTLDDNRANYLLRHTEEDDVSIQYALYQIKQPH